MKNVLDDKKQNSEEPDLLELLGLGKNSNDVASPTKINCTASSVTNTHINSSNFTCDSINNFEGDRYDRYDLDRNTNESNSFTNRKRKRKIGLNRSEEIFNINAMTEDEEQKNLEYVLALSLIEYEKNPEHN